jgi:hypothetical protein
MQKYQHSYESSQKMHSAPCQNILDNPETLGLNAYPSPKMTSSTTRRKRERRTEALVKPVILSLGESFIDHLVDGLRYGQGP